MTPNESIRNPAYRVALLTAALALTAACAAGRSALLSVSEPVSDRPQLTVTNHNWQEVRVYLVHGHDMNRAQLGTVHGGTRRTFQLPRAALDNPIRLLLQPVGGRANAYMTREFVVAGPPVDVAIETIINRSRVYAP